MKVGYGFDDVSIVPSILTSVESRSEIADLNYRIWVSPMDTVLGADNYEQFFRQGLNVPMVRNQWKSLPVSELEFPYFISLNLQEMEDLCNKDGDITSYVEEYQHKFHDLYILIDVANGHMAKVLDISIRFKTTYPHARLMVGNIANPKTYALYAQETTEFGTPIVDYIRVGIGGGSRCHTSSKTGIHYPMISLLKKIKKIKTKRNYQTQIIADGGIRNTSDICKAFVAGADGVMMGGMFARTFERTGQKYQLGENGYSPIENVDIPFYDAVYADFRGMSTISVQEKEGRTSNYEEGFSEYVKLEYSLYGLLTEINKSVKSSMSYCDAKTINELQVNAKLIINSSSNHNKI